METNPTSFLQEYLVRERKVAPTYTLIRQQSGTHINSFCMRIDCGPDSAEAEGTSKKEARFNAARKMIQKLNIKPNQCFPQQLNNSALNNNIENSLPNLQNGSSTPTVNYIGKLQVDV